MGYLHITDYSRPKYTVDWGESNPPDSRYPEEKVYFLGFSSEDGAKAFVSTFLKELPHRVYEGPVKLRKAGV